MRTSMRFCLAALAVLALTAPAGHAAQCLEVKSAALSRCFPLHRARFELSWIHSVERTEWRETYVVERSAIVLTASAFSSGGAGLPDRLAPGETLRNDHGVLRIEHRHLRIGELRIRLSPVSHHVLHVNGRDLDLNTIFGEGAVTLRVQRGGSDETAQAGSRSGPVVRSRGPRG